MGLVLPIEAPASKPSRRVLWLWVAAGLSAGAAEWVCAIWCGCPLPVWVGAYALGVVLRTVASTSMQPSGFGYDWLALVGPSMVIRHAPFSIDPTVNDLGLWPLFLGIDLLFHAPAVLVLRGRR